MINLSRIEDYRENNRIEAKKRWAGCPKAYGKRTLRSAIPWAELFCSAWRSTKTGLSTR